MKDLHSGWQLEDTVVIMESLDKIRLLIKSLLLPELKQDLDIIPIERDHFKSFHGCLETQLPLLYDFIQHDPHNFEWTGETNDIAKQEMQAYLIILLCEISSPDSVFKLGQSELTHNAERILQKSTNLKIEVHDLIFKYYEEKLHKDRWKKQLGAIHGFVKYLQFRFSTVCNLNRIMSKQFIMFCLSVALNIRSCYETHYKILSTLIFIMILGQGDKDDIISMNIHGVIYDAVFKDVSILDSTAFIVHQWNCLIKCLDFYTNFDSFSWNYLDDMMEVLLRNISLSPDSNTSICLLKFVNQLIVYFTIDHTEFKEFFHKDFYLVDDMDNCRSIAKSNTSYTCYRWAKCILQMFVIESYKLMQTAEIAKQILQEMHKIYILAILPIRLSIIEPHLIVFLQKFITVLLESLKIHKYQEDVSTIITSLLETFYFHLQGAAEPSNLTKYKENIHLLLKTDVLEKHAPE